MPANASTRVISDEEWEAKKETIRQLFIDQKKPLLGDDSVESHLASLNFFASKSQFETRLKKWGFRKYRNKETWRDLFGSSGQSSRRKFHDIHDGEQVIPAAKVRKVEARYKFVENSHTVAADADRPSCLPSSAGYDEVDSSKSLSEVSNRGIAQCSNNSDGLSHSLIGVDDGAQLQAPIFTGSQHNDNAGMIAPLFVPPNTQKAANIPFHIFEAQARKLALHLRSGMISPSSFVPVSSSSHTQIEILTLTPSSADTGSCLMRSGKPGNLLPTGLLQRPWDIGRSLKHVDPIFNNPLSRMILFSIANNFAGFGAIPIERALTCMKPHHTARLLGYLQRMTGPATDAIAENLFRSALEACDLRVVKTLMVSRRIDANSSILVKGCCHRYTLLERACMLQATAIVKFLISQGANPNRDDQGAPHIPALEHALSQISPRNTQLQVDTELIRVLVESGAVITSNAISCAVANPRREALLEILLSAGFKSNCCNWIMGDTLTSMLRYLDSPFDRAAVRTVVQRLTYEEQNRDDVQAKLRVALREAAGMGHLGIVQDLLKYTNMPGDILVFAVRSGSERLVEYLMDVGACINAPQKLPRQSFYISEVESANSPLSEAILAKDWTLQCLLEERGAFQAIFKELRFLERERNSDKLTLFQSTIHNAAKVGNQLMVERLSCVLLSSTNFHKGSLPSAILTAMNAAAEVGSRSTFERLLYVYSDAGLSKNYLYRVMLTAIYCGEKDIALLLLDAGANVRRPRMDDSNGRFGRHKAYHSKSALSLALERRDSTLVSRIMLTNPWRSRETNSHQSQSLQLAIQWGDRAIIEEILAVSHFRPRHLHQAIRVAVQKENSGIVELLMQLGAIINPPCYCNRDRGAHTPTSLLSEAVKARNEILVHYFLARGAPVDDSEALGLAVADATPLVRVLLNKFSDAFPNGHPSYGADALGIAIHRKDDELISTLIRAGINIHFFSDNAFNEASGDRAYSYSKPSTPLTMAIERDKGKNLEQVEQLLVASATFRSSTAVIQARNRHAINIALVCAVNTGEIEMVKLLLSYGAEKDPAASWKLPRTPLQKAAEIGNLDIVQLFLDMGVDVNQPAAYAGGATALQLAAIGGYLAIVQELLARGADVHAPAAKADGRTALEGAAEYGRLDVIHVLWNAAGGNGFDVREIESAKELAEENCHFATKNYIAALASTSMAQTIKPVSDLWEGVSADLVQAAFSQF